MATRRNFHCDRARASVRDVIISAARRRTLLETPAQQTSTEPSVAKSRGLIEAAERFEASYETRYPRRDAAAPLKRLRAHVWSRRLRGDSRRSAAPYLKDAQILERRAIRPVIHGGSRGVGSVTSVVQADTMIRDELTASLSLLACRQ